MDSDMNHLDEQLNATAGILRFTYESDIPLGAMHYPGELPSVLDEINALRFARHQIIWTLASFAFQLHRAEAANLSGTLRMSYFNVGKVYRNLDAFLDPIQGWIERQDQEGFLPCFSKSELPEYFAMNRKMSVQLFERTELNLLWETVGNFYAKTYDLANAEIPSCISKMQELDIDFTPRNIEKYVGSLTLSAIVLRCYESVHADQGLNFDVAVDGHSFTSAGSALRQLTDLVKQPLLGSRVEVYKSIWDGSLIQ